MPIPSRMLVLLIFYNISYLGKLKTHSLKVKLQPVQAVPAAFSVLLQLLV